MNNEFGYCEFQSDKITNTHIGQNVKNKSNYSSNSNSKLRLLYTRVESRILNEKTSLSRKY